MPLYDAQVAQGMATRHRRSVEAIVAGMGDVNALLALILKNNRIKWGGYGTYCEGYVRKLKEKASWVTGQLGSRTFTEKDPMDKFEHPYCFIEETYGVSEKSIKTNRAAGNEKIYDIQKENALNAQTAIYRAIVSALYSNGVADTLSPVGLAAIIGDAKETTSDVAVAAGKTYGGKTLNTSAISAWSKTYTTMGWDLEYWHPQVVDVHSIPTKSASPKWSTDGIWDLGWLETFMHRTADVSGTGKILKPDLALMNSDPWSALIKLLTTSQFTYNIPLGDADVTLAKFSHIRVGNLEAVLDDNVPDDGNTTALERVLVLDSKTFYIDTLNTKGEGLLESEWKTSDPEIVGGVGVYKGNMALVCESPLGVGAILGCHD